MLNLPKRKKDTLILMKIDADKLTNLTYKLYIYYINVQKGWKTMKKRGRIIKIVSVILSIALVISIGAVMYSNSTKIDLGEVTIEEAPQKSENATRIMSFNLRCVDDKEGSVYTRSQIATKIIDLYAPDSFGIQEATPKWIAILDEEFEGKYARVGEGRSPIELFTEYSAVYYRKDKFNLIDSGTIWLSETPEKKYTKSFDSKHNRIATWAVLEDKETGIRYTHINTHLDHVLESTRVEQSKVLLNKISELKNETTVICTGDFNTYETAEAYSVMSKSMTDTKLVAKNSDTGITFHKYGTITEHKDGAIDFIFTTEGVEVDTYKIIRDTFKGYYPSDHYPVVADVIL